MMKMMKMMMMKKKKDDDDEEDEEEDDDDEEEDDDDEEDENNNSMSRTPCRVCKGTGQMPVRGGGIVLGTQTCQGCGGLGYHVSW